MSTDLSKYAPGQTLLLDADDTLWENNIYFERAIAAFISYLDHRDYSRDEVREKLNEVERENTRLHGYGLGSFRRSLVICFERLSGESVTPEKHERIVSFVQSIADQEIELMPGVAEAIPQLASRHRLILMSKGAESEQVDKLARSGLHSYFAGIEIPKEKDTAAYHAVVAKYELAPHSTWMIGNSPKSDINPALTAGLHAIYIHHPGTWVLEHDQFISPGEGQNFLDLSSFGDLLLHF